METEPLPEWKRVVPVGVRFTTRNGGDAVLGAIEIWSDRITLHFGFEVTTHGLTDPDGRHRIGPGWSVSDDVGTDYEPMGGSAGGARDLSFGMAFFRAEVPADAQWLYVASPELLDPIEVSL